MTHSHMGTLPCREGLHEVIFCVPTQFTEIPEIVIFSFKKQHQRATGNGNYLTRVGGAVFTSRLRIKGAVLVH
jgi:hypothetical protein